PPASDHASSSAFTIASTLVPRPPAGLPPHHASGTLFPTICRTMSAAPFATSGECDTMTMPTFFAIRCSGSALQSRFQKTAHGRHDQFGGARSWIHVTLAALAQERRPAATRDHRYRLQRSRVRALADAGERACAVSRAQLIESRHQHVEHRLVPDIGPP